MLILSASLLTSVALLWPDPALAQASVSPNMQPSFGVGATSPSISGSGQRAGIPLGSTEIATPGVSPIMPLQNAGVGSCAGAGGGQSSGALFDGGGLRGLSGGMSLSCADASNPPSSMPSLSSLDRVGIPLGATELGNAGISPLSPVPSPNQSDNAIAAPIGSAQPNTNAGLSGAGP